VAGNCVLNGLLRVSLVDGFQPTAGDAFEILRASSCAGLFGTIQGLNVGANLYLKPEFTGTNVVLVATEGRPLPVFETVTPLAGGAMRMWIGEVAGQDFAVSYKDDLDLPAWTPFLTNYYSSSLYELVITNVTEIPHRFFRIELLPP
jgi:hypothetical protein